MGYLFAFLSVVSFGFSNCLWVFPGKRMPFLVVVSLRSLLSTLLFAGLYLLRSHEADAVPEAVPVVVLAKAILISMVSCIGLLLYVFSLRFTNVSTAVPVSSISTFFSILTAVLFLQEKFTMKILLAFLVLTAGLVLLDGRRGDAGKYYFSKGVWLNLGAAAFWGITFALFYIPVSALGPLMFSLVLESTVFTMSLVSGLILAQWKDIRFSNIAAQLKWIVPLAILGVGGVLFYNISLKTIPVIYVSLIGCLVPGISVLVSAVWLGEKLTYRKWLGVFVLIVGIATLLAK